MKFTKLFLKAFGPFTAQIIDFDSRGPGLHVIYGLNEAGKSSALRALRSLLFGFEERTADNFVHSNPNLLVGGVIEDESGTALEFYRRKKRIADLVDSDNNPLDPALLSRFMPGIGRELFISLYGIDHKMLVAGGEEILARRGEVGRALFAAGSGIATLSGVLDGLENEASELFKSRGTKQQINRSVTVYLDFKKMAREASLQPVSYQAHKKRREEAQAERLELEEQSRRLSTELERLSRLSRIIPELAEVDHLNQQLEELGGKAKLPATTAERSERISQEIDSLGPQIKKLGTRLASLKKRTETMSPDPAVLGQAAAIEDLYQRLGQYREGGKDRLKLDRDRAAQRRDAGLLIESIDPSLSLKQADALRKTLGRAKSIQRLCSSYEGLSQRLKQASRNLQKARKLKEEKEQQLLALAPRRKTESLAAAVKRGQSAGDIDARIDSLNLEIEQAEKSCRDELNGLGLWQGSLDDFVATPLPLRATLEEFSIGYQHLQKLREGLERDRRRCETEIEQAEIERVELLKEGEPPTEVDLQAVRAQRQQGWQLIRRSWLVGEKLEKEKLDYDKNLSLAAAYEKQVEEADRVADKLRSEADRSAQAAALHSRTEKLQEELAGQDDKLAEAARQAAEWQKRWNDVWRGLTIEPLSPVEMLDWYNRVDRLRLKLDGLSARRQEQTAALHSRSSLIQVLADELQRNEATVPVDAQLLAPLLNLAESLLAEMELNNQRHRTLTEELASHKNDRDRAAEEQEEAEEEMARWRLAWDEALTSLPIERRVTTDEAVDLLKTVDDCLKKLDAARGFASRIEGIDRDRTRFENDVRTLAGEVAADLAQDDPEQTVLRLYESLRRSREEKQLLSQDRETIDEVSSDLQSAEERLAELNGQLAAILEGAACRDLSELAAEVERSARIEQLIEKISTTESAIAKLSDGVELAAIRAQAADIDVDELPGLLLSLRRRLDEELAPRISELGEIIGAENRELALMDGRSRAAEAAEKMEQEGAVIQRLADRYVKITLASLILKREIEHYREAHQDPILKKGSEIFSGLTRGSFVELLTDIDERGNPVLIGRRGDGALVGVESMSDGTRDQLYLALRLATLYFRMQNGSPMPFVVDDILVNFDDARSRAALEALAALSERNQVILFTHHEKIVECAETLGSTAEVAIHRLPA